MEEVKEKVLPPTGHRLSLSLSQSLTFSVQIIQLLHDIIIYHKRKWPKKNQMFPSLAAGKLRQVLRTSLLLLFFKKRKVLIRMLKSYSIWQRLHKCLQQLPAVVTGLFEAVATLISVIFGVFTSGVGFHLTSWPTFVTLGLVSHSQNVRWTENCGARAVTHALICSSSCSGCVLTGASQLNIITFIPFLVFQDFFSARRTKQINSDGTLLHYKYEKAPNAGGKLVCNWIILTLRTQRIFFFMLPNIFYFTLNPIFVNHRHVFICFIVHILLFHRRQVSLRWCHSEFMNNICFACPDHSQLFV